MITLVIYYFSRFDEPEIWRHVLRHLSMAGYRYMRIWTDFEVSKPHTKGPLSMICLDNKDLNDIVCRIFNQYAINCWDPAAIVFVYIYHAIAVPVCWQLLLELLPSQATPLSRKLVFVAWLSHLTFHSFFLVIFVTLDIEQVVPQTIALFSTSKYFIPHTNIFPSFMKIWLDIRKLHGGMTWQLPGMLWMFYFSQRLAVDSHPFLKVPHVVTADK
jgi:hypothetical protein